jgi:hypothetical protein
MTRPKADTEKFPKNLKHENRKVVEEKFQKSSYPFVCCFCVEVCEEKSSCTCISYYVFLLLSLIRKYVETMDSSIHLQYSFKTAESCASKFWSTRRVRQISARHVLMSMKLDLGLLTVAINALNYIALVCQVRQVPGSHLLCQRQCPTARIVFQRVSHEGRRIVGTVVTEKKSGKVCDR